MSYEEYKVNVPEGRIGNWEVRRFTVSEESARHDSVMSSLKGHGRYVPEGTYTALWRGSPEAVERRSWGATLVMSDTPDEIKDHIGFIRRAKGRVLIAGLGLGVVLQAVARKPEVESVTVVEKSEDVINLVRPAYEDRPWWYKVILLNADIFEFKPCKANILAFKADPVTYDCAWFDIWDNICTDNLKDIATLNRRFARIVPDRGHWVENLLRYNKRREKRMGW